MNIYIKKVNGFLLKLTFNVNSLAKARTHSLFELYNILHQIKVYEEPVSMKKNQEVMIKWDFLGKMRGHKISALPDEASAVLLILLVCLFEKML